jgi:hypothetical protein
MKDPILVWTEPPPDQRGRIGRTPKYARHVEILTENPERWACIARYPKARPAASLAQNIKRQKGYQRISNGGRLEATVRFTGEDYGVWARWMPA